MTMIATVDKNDQTSTTLLESFGNDSTSPSLLSLTGHPNNIHDSKKRKQHFIRLERRQLESNDDKDNDDDRMEATIHNRYESSRSHRRSAHFHGKSTYWVHFGTASSFLLLVLLTSLPATIQASPLLPSLSSTISRQQSQQFVQRLLAKEETTEECTVPAGVCTHCTFSEQENYEQCLDTGRWQKFKCVPLDDDEEMEEITESNDIPESYDDDATYQMKSCKYTPLDEGIAMVRLQVICLLIGGLAIVSVRKQKRLSASMFDRRKQQRTPANNNNSTNSNRGKRNSCIVNDDEEHEIEFSTMTNQTTREMAPLVARMEII